MSLLPLDKKWKAAYRAVSDSGKVLMNMKTLEEMLLGEATGEEKGGRERCWQVLIILKITLIITSKYIIMFKYQGNMYSKYNCPIG